ncbi:MAG: class I SAM-dependent methyltransferase [Planctomycetota bacterium]|jgi:2-polyprenyl-3-methyl-5-hydroxy-6-metoxy-1,4-benzoquinol methylase|nr:class I SAM-dependent methyltransferase [Planctomycetota bacterium]
MSHTSQQVLAELAIDTDLLTETNCALCGCRERRLEFREGPFAIYTCSDCHLTYTSPRLSQSDLVREIYGESYWRSPAARERGYTDYLGDHQLILRTCRRRADLVENHTCAPGRVLDVGCAAGFFLQVMAERGWDAHGLEPSAAIRPQAEERLGTERIHGGFLKGSPFEPASFDLITLWDVLEHIPDPLAALRRIHTLLAPGGVLILETQNVRSLTASVLGRRWHHYKLAEHLFHFHPGTIRQALEQTGFSVHHNHARQAGKYVDLDFALERSKRVMPALGWLLSPLRALGNPVLYVNLFDEMIVVARHQEELPVDFIPQPAGAC